MKDPEDYSDWTAYQIYPKSFNDSDGDGIGDIPGIVEKLDYIESLGVDAVWLNPVYPSPHVDNGYDISDHREIDPDLGTMDDWERLRNGLHDRGIALIMDLVLNHTSDEHRWFKNSRREKDDFGNWYHWREGSPDKPPNNWESFFSDSAWSWDEEREAWYLHLFHERQPDLNWRNPRVRKEMIEVVEFWKEKGVDGFRLDVLNVLSKAKGLPDGGRRDEGLVGSEHYINGPRIHEYVSEVLDATGNLITVGEMPELTVDTAEAFMHDGLDMVFQFDHLESGRERRTSWNMEELADILQKWQRSPVHEGLFLTNHDQPRAVSRFGSEEYRERSAKALMTLVMTLKGTPFIYQGEEIGMTSFPWDEVSQVDDVESLNRAETIMASGGTEEDALEWIRSRSRDNARTPMQWSSGENAGFTSGEPWLPVNPNHAEMNVEDNSRREDSALSYFQELVRLRKSSRALRRGRFRLRESREPSVLRYSRETDSTTCSIVLNLSDAALDAKPGSGELLLSNCNSEKSSMRPWEARVYRR